MSLQTWLSNFFRSVGNVASKFEVPAEVAGRKETPPERRSPSDRYDHHDDDRHEEPSRNIVGLMSQFQIYAAFERALRRKHDQSFYDKDTWHEILGEEVHVFLAALVKENPTQGRFHSTYMENIWSSLETRGFLEDRFCGEGEAEEEDLEESEEDEEFPVDDRRDYGRGPTLADLIGEEDEEDRDRRVG